MESEVMDIVDLTKREIHLIRMLIETDAIIMSITLNKGEQINTKILSARLEALLKHQVSLIKSVDVTETVVGFRNPGVDNK
jgi:hypothetical protein